MASGQGTNFFTRKPFDTDMTRLTYNKPVTLTSIDLPYFSVLCFREKRKIDPSVGDFKDIFQDISDEGWAVLDPSTKKDEFDFLEDLGLAIKQDDTYYVSKFAYLFYDPEVGLFNRFDRNAPPDEIKTVLAPVMQLFLTYILPGRWWRAFYARQYLPDTIGQASMLNQELLEIEDEIEELEDEYGYSQSSVDAEPPAKS